MSAKNTNVASVTFNEGRKYPCVSCDFQATRRQRLTEHHLSIHVGKKYKCNQCILQFSQKRSLRKRHQLVYEGM